MVQSGSGLVAPLGAVFPVPDLRGTLTPAASSQVAARAVWMDLLLSTLSVPVAFLMGANSSAREVS
jgi:hypothetical protein